MNKIVAYLVASAVALSGCAGEVRQSEAQASDQADSCTVCLGERYVVSGAVECIGETVPCDPCAGSKDVVSCHQCLNYPPRGAEGLSVCQTASGPSGASCCSQGTECKATHFDGKSDVTAECSPVVDGAVRPIY